MAMLETKIIIIVILLLLMVLMLFLFSLVILFACKPWRYLPLFRSSTFKVKVFLPSDSILRKIESIARRLITNGLLVVCLLYYLIGNENVLVDFF